MKKFLLLLVLVCTANMVFAQSGPTRTILHPTTNGHGSNSGQYSKAPLAPVYVYQDGHTLTFESNCIGATITIIKDGEEVYTDIVDPTCEMTIPESISGTIEIRLTRGNVTYWGLIIL